MTPFDCLAPGAIAASLVAPARSSAFCAAVLALPARTTALPLDDYAVLLAMTLLFEAPAYLLLGRLARRSLVAGALALLGANLATHPAVVYALPRLAVALGLDLGAMTLMQEGFAVTVEALVLCVALRMSVPAALLGSIVANLTSWWIGILIQTGGAAS